MMGLFNVSVTTSQHAKYLGAQYHYSLMEFIHHVFYYLHG